jgi:heat shock protein HslJ
MHQPRRPRAHHPLRALLVLLGTLVILLAACGGGGASGSPLPSAVDLEGTIWRATLIRDAAPLVGAEPTLRFEGGQASGTTGCNTYGGAYHIDAGGAFKIDSMIMTEMACDGARGTQEGVVTDILSKADKLEFLSDGQIRISGPSGSITFAVIPG